MDTETQFENESSLVKRINRRLVDNGQRLTVSRSPGALGRYIIVDGHTGNPVAWADTLDEWARELEMAS
jgi:hypothetical protein